MTKGTFFGAAIVFGLMFISQLWYNHRLTLINQSLQEQLARTSESLGRLNEASSAYQGAVQNMIDVCTETK